MPVTGNVPFFRRGICKSCCGVSTALLTRLFSFPFPILALFFEGYFPMLSFLPALFFFFLVCTSVSHAFSELTGHWKGQRANQRALPLQKQYIKPNNHKPNKNSLSSSSQFFSFRQKGPGGGKRFGTSPVYVYLMLSLLEPNILQGKYRICAANSLLLLWNLPVTGNGTE